VTVQETAREISKDVVNVMTQVADMLSETLEMGDPPATHHTRPES